MPECLYCEAELDELAVKSSVRGIVRCLECKELTPVRRDGMRPGLNGYRGRVDQGDIAPEPTNDY